MNAVIYTTPTCAYCPMVKKYLEGKGIQYQTVNLEEEPQTRQELFELLGAMTVPITKIERTINRARFVNYVVGWNVAKLNEAIK